MMTGVNRRIVYPLLVTLFLVTTANHLSWPLHSLDARTNSAIRVAPFGGLAPLPGTNSSNTGGGSLRTDLSGAVDSNNSTPANSTNSTSLNYSDVPQVIVPGQNYTIPAGANLSNISLDTPQGPGPYSNHWWYGDQFMGSTGSTNNLSLVMLIPHDLPVAGDYFFAGLLSIYDSNNIYDQIGFMSNYNSYLSNNYPSGSTDTWEVTWAALNGCGLGSTTWNADTYALIPGTYYNFSMSITGGTITYEVDELLGNPGSFQYPVWSTTFYTGATSFQVDNQISCGSTYYQDYTDYEESYYTGQQNDPNWNMYYYANTAGGSPEYLWAPWASGTPPSGRWTNVQGGHDFVYNEYFALNLSAYQLSASAGSTITINGWVDDDYTNLCVYNSHCAISSITNTYILPTGGGWSVGFSPSSGNPSFTYVMTVHVPSTAVGTWYTLGVKAFSSVLNAFTTLQLQILVIKPGTGGGCVAYGTSFSTPSGPVTVQALSTGQTIHGYNLSTGEIVDESISSINVSSVGSYVSINHGQVNVTFVDQPLYIRNLTFTGWLRDPQNLTLGELLFDPSTGKWAPIFSLVGIQVGITVYDVQASGPHDFIIGDPVLAQVKAHGGGV